MSALEEAFAQLHSADERRRGATLTASEVHALARHLDRAQDAAERAARALRVAAKGADDAFRQTCEAYAQALERVAKP